MDRSSAQERKCSATKRCKSSAGESRETMITSVIVPNRKAALLLAAPPFAPFPGELDLSSQHAFHIANQAWMIWAIWWLAMAFFSKSTKRRESVIQRIDHLVPALLGFTLIFRAEFGGAWLARPVFSANPLLLLI